MTSYLKIINKGKYSKRIDDIISLFKTCDYLEDMYTEFISYKLVYCEKNRLKYYMFYLGAGISNNITM